MRGRIAFLLVVATALCVGGNAWAWSSSKPGPQAAQAAASGIKPENGTAKTSVNQAYGGACATAESYYRKLWIRCGDEKGGVPFRVGNANPGGSRVEGDATDAEGNG
jgi:hypothetical protein